MISQSLKAMKGSQFQELFKILLFIPLLILFSCNAEKSKRIKAGEFDMEGSFIKGVIPDGVIKYYLPNTNNLVGSKEFVNGVVNGKSVNYYNSKIIQVVNYKNGVESGFSEIYDSSGSNLRQRDFYYYGRKIGPSYGFDEERKLLFFDFKNFENKVLYSVEYNSVDRQYYSDDFEKLENLNVSESIVNNQKKLRVFFYLIYPPKAIVTYKICYMDKSENIIDSIKVSKTASDFYWEDYIDYPKADQTLALVITKYDSTSRKNQVMINYIESYQKK